MPSEANVGHPMGVAGSGFARFSRKRYVVYGSTAINWGDIWQANGADGLS
ncbi:MAG: hypothetical protein F6K30_00365 [Cyanothece sp. SIO2G6]|nr:hypothetical protein [Cyanothece sp. SIO2G6]